MTGFASLLGGKKRVIALDDFRRALTYESSHDKPLVAYSSPKFPGEDFAIDFHGAQRFLQVVTSTKGRFFCDLRGILPVFRLGGNPPTRTCLSPVAEALSELRKNSYPFQAVPVA